MGWAIFMFDFDGTANFEYRSTKVLIVLKFTVSEIFHSVRSVTFVMKRVASVDHVHRRNRWIGHGGTAS